MRGVESRIKKKGSMGKNATIFNEEHEKNRLCQNIRDKKDNCGNVFSWIHYE